jgi:hypothetical protein
MRPLHTSQKLQAVHVDCGDVIVRSRDRRLQKIPPEDRIVCPAQLQLVVMAGRDAIDLRRLQICDGPEHLRFQSETQLRGERAADSKLKGLSV